MECYYEDDQLMDEEIIEALDENHFQHHDQNVEANCHNNHENSQILVSSLVVDEIIQHTIESYVPSLEFDEILQLCCKILCDQVSDDGS